MFISYAQNFEDVMLWRSLKHVEKGFYIDIGAQDPVIDSVSMAFYEHGWRGMHVEPASHYAKLLRAHRKDETVMQTAVGAKQGSLKFFEIADSGLSTCDVQIAERHRSAGYTVHETIVPSVTLSDIFKSCADREVHWLKIDVEGLEEQVIQGWQPSKKRPWVVVVESVSPVTRTESYSNWEQSILDLGYEFVYFDGLNRFYLSKNHLDLKQAFLVSPNLFDNFTLSGTATSTHCALLKERLTTEISRLSCTLDAIYRSRSWRLTYPLRVVKRFIRAITITKAQTKQGLG